MLMFPNFKSKSCNFFFFYIDANILEIYEPSFDITSKYNYMFFQFYCLNHLLIHQPLAKQPHAAI